MDPVGVALLALMVGLLVGAVLLGAYSPRSPRDYLDWKPTRSAEVEAQNELDDVAQMIEAQNAMRRRRGAAEITEEDVEARVRADEEERRRWRAS